MQICNCMTHKKEDDLRENVKTMVTERAEAGKNRDRSKSSGLCDRIIKAGYIPEDTRKEQKVRKNV